MSVKALQDYTFVSKYARYRPDLKRRETWAEAVNRVEAMHLRRYPQIKKEIRWAFDQVRKKRVLGSQRALQFGGPAMERVNARGYNCTASYCDRVRFFQEAFWLLLCGCGVGFSVQKHHVAKLPFFCPMWLGGNPRSQKRFVVPDSIEGWADSAGVLLSSYLGGGDFPEYEGCEVVFDYSLIRPEGAPLSSSSGKAPGPKPLMVALDKVRSLLDRCCENGQSRLRPIDAYDIVMHLSDAVLSGGVRRSATLCMFSPDDEEMASAKTGNWFVENPQRGRSNNSALLIRNKTSKEEFRKLMRYVREFGEPGFIWADSTEVVFNPCVEVSLYPVDVETGLTGWQKCNLVEINGRKCHTPEDFATAVKAAAIISTCQAGYTDFAYLGPVTERIVRLEALLGVSITGIMDNPAVLLDPKIQRTMAKLVLKTNEQIATKIGINPTARATCLKPAGTTSCILGTASGIHPHHARRYIRRTQANHLEPPLSHFKRSNPHAVEKSVWSASGTDEVIAFCIEVQDGAKTKNDMGAVELLSCVKTTQENWVAYGTRKDRCVQPWLMHNVSNTITVKPDEWDAVTDFIYENRRHFAGVSLLPISGDKDYPQAPFTAVYTPVEIVRMYGDASILASGLVVDGLYAFDNNLWAACDVVLGRGEQPVAPEQTGAKEDGAWALEHLNYLAKTDWVRRAKQFADRYFGGDVRQMTYCLKDVNNWHLWCSLKREYRDVDYTTMIEERDNTTVEQTVACSGPNGCELSFVAKAS